MEFKVDTDKHHVQLQLMAPLNQYPSFGTIVNKPTGRISDLLTQLQVRYCLTFCRANAPFMFSSVTLSKR